MKQTISTKKKRQTFTLYFLFIKQTVPSWVQFYSLWTEQWYPLTVASYLLQIWAWYPSSHLDLDKKVSLCRSVKIFISVFCVKHFWLKCGHLLRPTISTFTLTRYTSSIFSFPDTQPLVWKKKNANNGWSFDQRKKKENNQIPQGLLTHILHNKLSAFRGLGLMLLRRTLEVISAKLKISVLALQIGTLPLVEI